MFCGNNYFFFSICGNRGSEEDRLASKTLYIGNIPYSFREPEVEDMFKKFGIIIKVTVVLDQYTQRNKG